MTYATSRKTLQQEVRLFSARNVANQETNTFSKCPLGLNLSKTFCVTLHISYMPLIIQKFFCQFISNHLDLENSFKMTPTRRSFLYALFFICFSFSQVSTYLHSLGGTLGEQELKGHARATRGDKPCFPQPPAQTFFGLRHAFLSHDWEDCVTSQKHVYIGGYVPPSLLLSPRF